MKKILVLILILALSAASVAQGNIKNTDFVSLDFDQIFKEINPKEIDANVFKLLNEDWSIVTAGIENDYNSMIASWGGFGMLFEKPVSWIFLNASRFTLEKVRENGKFTLSYLDSTYIDQKKLLGSKSGRNTDKMDQITLHKVETPSGNITYKEAYMIIELNVDGIMELNPDNFRSENSKESLINGLKNGNGKNYHQMITGIITNVWVRK